jgi:hypothetical protein
MAGTSLTLGANNNINNNLKTATLNDIWDDLKSGIESVYSQQTMSKPRYMNLYS